MWFYTSVGILYMFFFFPSHPVLILKDTSPPLPYILPNGGLGLFSLKRFEKKLALSCVVGGLYFGAQNCCSSAVLAYCLDSLLGIRWTIKFPSVPVLVMCSFTSLVCWPLRSCGRSRHMSDVTSRSVCCCAYMYVGRDKLFVATVMVLQCYDQTH